MTLNPRVLDEMAEHAAYEMWMLRNTTLVIEANTFPTASPDMATMTIGNALLESSLLHLRSLDDFFYLRRTDLQSGSDDVLALDYLPTWSPRRILTKDERATINKRILHLTTDRVGERLPWQVQRSHDAYEVCWTFVRELKASDGFLFAFEKLLRWFPPKDANG